MTREEAINLVKQVFPCLNVDEKIREGFKTLIPELAESEDERMMREFNDWLCEEIECRTNDLRDEKDRRTLNMLCYILTKVKAYLEKQKINTEGDFGRGYDCGYEACLNSHGAEWLEKQKDVPSRETTLGIWKLGNFWKENQVERDGLTQLQYIQKYLCLGLKNATIDYLKEQKPRKFKLGDKVHWHDDDTNVITITGFRDDAYLTDSAYGPILFCDEDNWERVEQKPVDWSEGDEEMLNSCISSIEEAKENRYAYKETDGDTSYDHEIAWLKSLRRPKSSDNWKPSEDQMNVLLNAEGMVRANGCPENAKVLASLYEQLKKLI